MATINDIKTYVRETPYNTNPNVLNSLLDSLESNNGQNVVITEGTFENDTLVSLDKTYDELNNADLALLQASFETGIEGIIVYFSFTKINDKLIIGIDGNEIYELTPNDELIPYEPDESDEPTDPDEPSPSRDENAVE